MKIKKGKPKQNRTRAIRWSQLAEPEPKTQLLFSQTSRARKPASVKFANDLDRIRRRNLSFIPVDFRLADLQKLISLSLSIP